MNDWRLYFQWHQRSPGRLRHWGVMWPQLHNKVLKWRLDSNFQIATFGESTQGNPLRPAVSFWNGSSPAALSEHTVSLLEELAKHGCGFAASQIVGIPAVVSFLAETVHEIPAKGQNWLATWFKSNVNAMEPHGRLEGQGPTSSLVRCLRRLLQQQYQDQDEGQPVIHKIGSQPLYCGTLVCRERSSLFRLQSQPC